MSDIDLSTNLVFVKPPSQKGGATTTTTTTLHFPFCVYNASGPRSGNSTVLNKIANSYAGAVLTKSATVLSQTGNPQPRTYHNDNNKTIHCQNDPVPVSFNSEGLPNNGIDYYISNSTIEESMMDGSGSNNQQQNEEDEKKMIKKFCHKPYIVSLSGKTLDDNIEMLRRISKSISNDTILSIASIELNLACPNVVGKPIIGYDYDQMKFILTSITKVYMELQNLPPLGIKLPPYFDFQHYQIMCSMINQYEHIIQYVVSINTVGNTLCIDTIAEAPVIAANQGFAGMSGAAVKYIALANVRKLRELLNPSISIIGVGGIRTGQDVFDMLLCGANACQVGTTHWIEGPICFERIYKELYELMKQKGYTSITKDVINKLKPYSKDGAEVSRQYYNTKKKQSEFVSKKSVSSFGSFASTTGGNELNEATYYKFISIALSIILAILAYDKWTTAALLPVE